MLRKIYDQGYQAAMARYKIANATPGCAINPAQSSATAMPMAPAKSPISPTAPVATAAPRSSVLG